MFFLPPGMKQNDCSVFVIFSDCQDVYDNHGGKNYPGYSYIMIQPYIANMPFEVCCKMTNDSGK